MRESARVTASSHLWSAPVVAVTSGKSNAGTTTLAINISAALSQQGQRVLLIDANPHRPAIAGLCNLQQGFGLAEVIQCKRTIHEVIQCGPAGIHVIAGSHGSQQDNSGLGSFQRFWDQMRAVELPIDIAVLDVASVQCGMSDPVWDVADHVVIVSTCDSQTILDTYAMIKARVGGVKKRPEIRILVNHADSESEATITHRRLAQSCSRFLSVDVEMAGWIRHDEELCSAAKRGVPLVVQSPTCPTARSIDRIATNLAAATTRLPAKQQEGVVASVGRSRCEV